MSEKLYENEYFYIEKENALIPWVKIFTQKPYKELSDCDKTTQEAIDLADQVLVAIHRGAVDMAVADRNRPEHGRRDFLAGKTVGAERADAHRRNPGAGIKRLVRHAGRVNAVGRNRECIAFHKLPFQ